MKRERESTIIIREGKKKKKNDGKIIESKIGK